MNMSELRAMEFRKMMNDRSSTGRVLDMEKAPVPEMPFFNYRKSRMKRGIVRGVREPFFEALNGKDVSIYNVKSKLVKYERDTSGEILKEIGTDKPSMQVVPCPLGSIAVVSDVNIKLRREYEKDGARLRYHMSKGFNYVDYRDNGGRRRYIYILPRDHVYSTNECALVLTPNTRRLHYGGYKVALQNGMYVYFYVVPFKRVAYEGTRILGVGKGVDFEKPMLEVLRLWVKLGVMFHPELTDLDDPVRGVKNVGLIPVPPTLSLADYELYETTSLKIEDDLWDD